MHGLGVRQDKPELDRVYHIDPANALETSGSFDFDFIDVKIGLVEGSFLMVIEGHGLPFCGQDERPVASGPRLPFVQQMNLSPCWIYDVKSAVSDQNNRKSAFFMEYPVLGSLCVQ